MTLLTCSFTWISFDRAESVSKARSPIVAANADSAAFEFAVLNDTLADSLQHDVVIWRPSGPHAPLPPGVSKWPNKRGVLLSPTLRKEGVKEGIAQRYGQDLGDIGADGLIFPDERLAYLFEPAGTSVNGLVPADRFGMGGGGIRGGFGEGWQILGPGAFWWLIVSFLLLPSLAVVGVSSGAGAEHVAHRDAVLRALGASPWTRCRYRLRACAWGVAAGAALSGIALVLAALIDWRVPVTGWLVSASIVREHLPLLIATTVVSPLIPLAWFVLPPRLAASTRPRARSRRIPAWAALSMPASLFVTTRLPDLLDASGGETWRWTYRLGLLSLLISIPITVAAATSWATKVMRASSSPPRILAGAWLDAHHSAVFRSASLLAVVALVSVQVQAWASMSSGEVRAAIQAQRQLNDGAAILTMTPGDSAAPLLARHPELDSLQVRLPQDVEGTTPTDVWAACPALTRWGLPCRGTVQQAELREPGRTLMPLLSPTSRLAFHATPAPQDSMTSHAVVLLSSHPIDLPALKHDAWATLSPALTLDKLGTLYVSGAVSLATQSRWVALLGGWSLLITLLALATDTANTALRRARQVAPLAAVAARPSIAPRLALWTTALPIAISGGMALLASGFATAPLSTLEHNPADPSLWITGGVVITAATALIAGVAVSYSMRQAITTWLPGRDR